MEKSRRSIFLARVQEIIACGLDDQYKVDRIMELSDTLATWMYEHGRLKALTEQANALSAGKKEA